jgi:ribosomal protein S18 acetylase RimI-like enzyme
MSVPQPPRTAGEFVIRHYRTEDRGAVRSICCDTGFLGNPVDPVFEDRELFADFLTGYYLDAEPESAVVLEEAGVVRGYITGCRHPRRKTGYELRHFPGRALRLVRGLLTRYGPATRRYLCWLALRGRKECPDAPAGLPHFHINLLPEYRRMATTRHLLDYFLAHLARCGEASVYGQVVAFGDRRAAGMFARYGFQVRDSAEVTKFRAYTDQKVYLFTVVRDLRGFQSLYEREARGEG